MDYYKEWLSIIKEREQTVGVKEFFEKARSIRKDVTSVSVDYNESLYEPYWTFWIHYTDYQLQCLQGGSPEQALTKLAATVEETTLPDEIHIEFAESESQRVK